MLPLTLGVVILSSLVILLSPANNQKIATFNPTPVASEIILLVPHPNQSLALESGKTLKGAVDSSWFSGAVFPVIFTDTSGNILYQTQAQTQSQSAGVFQIKLDYPSTLTGDGFIILRSANDASQELSFPITFINHS